MTPHILLAFLFGLLLGGLATPPPGIKAPEQETAIEGRVVRLPGGEPLNRAQLTLFRVPSPTEPAAVSEQWGMSEMANAAFSSTFMKSPMPAFLVCRNCSGDMDG